MRAGPLPGVREPAAARRLPAREIVLYGPYVNDKTARLASLQKETDSSPGVNVIRLVPGPIRTETRLDEHLLPTSWWQRLTPNEISVHDIKWHPGNDRPPLDKGCPRT